MIWERIIPRVVRERRRGFYLASSLILPHRGRRRRNRCEETGESGEVKQARRFSSWIEESNSGPFRPKCLRALSLSLMLSSITGFDISSYFSLLTFNLSLPLLSNIYIFFNNRTCPCKITSNLFFSIIFYQYKPTINSYYTK